MRRLFTVLTSVALPALVLFFATSSSSYSQYPLTPLVEEMTSSTCPPCAPASPIMNDNTHFADGVLSVRYHMNWPGSGNDPHYVADNAQGNFGRKRNDWYGNSGIPAAFVNGKTKFNPVSEEAGFSSSIASAKQQTTPVKLEISENRSDLENIQVTIKVTSEQTLNNVYLRAAVLARNTYIYNLATRITWNGETHFRDAMLTMLPDNLGTRFSINAGETKEYTFSYAMGSGELWPEGSIYTVVWVQDDADRRIYQSASNAVKEVGAELDFEGSSNIEVERAGSVTQDVIVSNPNDEEYEFTVWVDSDVMPSGWSGSVNPSTVTIPAGGEATVQVTINSGADALYTPVIVRAKPLPTEIGVLADEANTVFNLITAGAKYAVFTGLNNFAGSLYYGQTLAQSSKYGSEVLALPATVELIERYGSQFEAMVLPLRYDNVWTGNQYVLGGTLLTKVREQLALGKGIAIFSHASITYAFGNAEGAQTKAWFQELGIAPGGDGLIQRYTLNGSNIQPQQFQLSGITGDPVGAGINMSNANAYQSSTNPYFDPYTDQMSVSGDAVATMYYDGETTSIAGARVEVGDNGGRLAYFGFGLESMPSMRSQLMEQTMNWITAGEVSQGPQIATSLEDIEFGQVETGKSASEEITIRNTGGEVLTISNIEISDIESVFSVMNAPQLPLAVEPGSSYTLTVAFEPTEEKMYQALLIVDSDAENTNSVIVDLYGQGKLTSSVVDGTDESADLLLKAGQNPFSVSTSVEYTLKGQVADRVQLVMYNGLGQEVAVLKNATIEPGTYTAEINGANLMSGTYYLTLKSSASSVSIPLVLTK